LVYYRSTDSQEVISMWAVDITTEPSFVAGTPKELFTGKYETSTSLRSYDVTPDGQRFVMIDPGPPIVEPVTQLHVTLNWFEELKRLAPTD
jgi:hypothetical protein